MSPVLQPDSRIIQSVCSLSQLSTELERTSPDRKKLAAVRLGMTVDAVQAAAEYQATDWRVTLVEACGRGAVPLYASLSVAGPFYPINPCALATPPRHFYLEESIACGELRLFGRLSEVSQLDARADGWPIWLDAKERDRITRHRPTQDQVDIICLMAINAPENAGRVFTREELLLVARRTCAHVQVTQVEDFRRRHDGVYKKGSGRPPKTVSRD